MVIYRVNDNTKQAVVLGKSVGEAEKLNGQAYLLAYALKGVVWVTQEECETEVAEEVYQFVKEHGERIQDIDTTEDMRRLIESLYGNSCQGSDVETALGGNMSVTEGVETNGGWLETDEVEDEEDDILIQT